MSAVGSDVRIDGPAALVCRDGPAVRIGPAGSISIFGHGGVTGFAGLVPQKSDPSDG